MTRQIAIVGPSRMHLNALIDTMEERGFSTTYHMRADTAIPDFTTGTKYGLIAIEPYIAPGEYTDPIVDRIMHSTYPEYPLIGAHVIRRTREPTSINRDTPIVVMGIIVGDQNRARSLFLEVGATEYVNYTHLRNMNAFYNRLEQLARK